MAHTLLANALDLVRDAAHPLTGASHDYDPLLDLAGDAQFVLIGEASHGAHECYRERAAITRRLIVERGFNAVAVEADWPDAYLVNGYVRGDDCAASAQVALSGFRRFPAWMWRNAEVLGFIGWLRAYNDARAERARVGFYGLDLYSLFTSMTVVLDYLDKVDPEAASHARYRYACFERVGEDPHAYGYAASLDLSSSCEDEVLSQLVELLRRAWAHNSHLGDARGTEMGWGAN